MIDFWYEAFGAGEEDHHLSNEEQIKSDTWEAIQYATVGQPQPFRHPVVKMWWRIVYFRLAVAAVLVFLGFIFSKDLSDEPALIAGVPNDNISNLVKEVNNSSQGKRVVLSDGSTVKLGPGAVLYYPEKFAARERKVFLSGNGFFTVTPNKTSPVSGLSRPYTNQGSGNQFRYSQKRKR